MSLALVVIGGVHAPPSIVEPLIAASIAWVGLENLRARAAGARWLVVFGFGLIHGFGFAGALLELGFGSSAAEIARRAALVQRRRRGRPAGGGGGDAAARLDDQIAAAVAGEAAAVVLGDDCRAGGYWLIER